MSTSDIENFASVSDDEASTHVSASTQGPVPDHYSRLSRQERAPLEISNASNLVQGSRRAHSPTAVKNHDGLDRRTPEEQHLRRSIDNSLPYDEESFEVDARERRWSMLAARLDEERTFSYFHDTSVPDREPHSEFDQLSVEAAQDRFRELSAQTQVEDSNYFAEIIDVDREAGFGEDGDFGEDQSVSNSGLSHATEQGMRESYHGTTEDRQEVEPEEDDLSKEVQRCREELLQFRKDRREKFMKKSFSSLDSGTAWSSPGRDFTKYTSSQDSEIQRNISLQDMNILVDGTVNSAKLAQSVQSSEEFEAESDDEWERMKAEPGEEGVSKSDCEQSGWELGNEEVQLEDKPRALEQEKMMAQAGKEHRLQEKQENLNEVIEGMIVEMQEENAVNEEEECPKEPMWTSLMLAAIGKGDTDKDRNPYSLLILAFEDLLREADRRADRERERVDEMVFSKEETEGALQQHLMEWSEREKKYEGRINSLEMQHTRLADSLRETATALTLEKERRRESRTEVDKILEMLKRERKSHQETLEKLGTCVNSLMKLRGNLAMQKSRSAEDGGPSYLQVVETVLRDMDKELQINLHHLTRKSSDVDYHSMDVDELSTWKQQRDALELERDNIEESLTLLLRETRERHGEMEAVWLERETLLEQKVGCIEVELQHSQMKQRKKDAEILKERARWVEELENCRQAWGQERAAWEATVRERDERLGEQIALWDSSLVEEHGVASKIVDKTYCEDSSDISDYDFKEMDEVHGSAEVQDAAREGQAAYSRDPSFRDEINQFCDDVANLDQEMDTGEEGVKEDLRSQVDEWELEKMKWKGTEMNFRNEIQTLENRVASTLALMEELKNEIKLKEADMDEERKQRQAILCDKMAEVEKLTLLLKSKEHDMEITVQKFMDEVRLIGKEVDKERKEREQVMELHFASKRKVVTDFKEREEKWENEMEDMTRQLTSLKMEIRLKEREIEDLKRSSVEATSNRECHLIKAPARFQQEKDVLPAELSKENGEASRTMEEMLAGVWKVCEVEQVQSAVEKRLGPGQELTLQRPMLESLWLEHCKIKQTSDDQKSTEWELAANNIARFDKQISEAMSDIDILRAELSLKETAKANREREWQEKEREWVQERGQLMKRLEIQKQKERQLSIDWEARNQELFGDKEVMEKSYKLELVESADTISNLQGAVRELEWVLKQTRGGHWKDVKHGNEGRIVRSTSVQSATKTAELVKVHASYLDEVDQYILELESKRESSEKNLRTPGVLAVKDRSPEMNLALMEIEKELYSTAKSNGHLDHSSSDDDGNYCPPGGMKEWNMPGGVRPGSSPRESWKRVSKPGERNMCLTLNGLATLAQDTWAEGADAHSPLWQADRRNSPRGWISPRTSMEDRYASGVVTLPVSPPPTSRRQQKWMVDASWLEQVRKEHAWLRQQLEVERQRVAALGRVEADNRWIEAAIIRALELKRESDSKVADMQRKVNVMEVLMSKSNSMPTSY